MQNEKEKVDTLQKMLKVVYGVVPIVAGLDKFTNLLVDWKQYLSPIVANAIPAHVLMPVIGIVEIVAGLIVLSRWTRFGAYIVSIWLLCIAINLITTGHYFDVAVRDIVMAFGAFTLAQLTETRARVATVARPPIPTEGTPVSA